MREVENRLPRSARGVVRAARTEARAFADIFFPTVCTSALVSMRIVREGGKLVKKHAEEGARRVSMAVKEVDVSRRATLARDGARAKALHTASSVDRFRAKAIEHVARFVDAKRGEAPIANASNVMEAKGKPRPNGSKGAANEDARGPSASARVSARELRASSKEDRARVIDCVPKRAKSAIKDALHSIEGASRSPVAKVCEPKVREFVAAIDDGSRALISALRDASEGGLTIARESSAELVRRARLVKPRVTKRANGLKSAFAVAAARARQLKGKNGEDAPLKRDSTPVVLTSSAAALVVAPARAEEELLAKPRRVIVSARDNLFDIASVAGISVMDLARYNNLRPDPHTSFIKLVPGQELFIPSQSLLDHLPAVDLDEEPVYELSVKVRPPKKSKRFIDPALHSRNAPVEIVDLAHDEKRALASTIAGSLALVACALALRSIRGAMDAEDDDGAR